MFFLPRRSAHGAAKVAAAPILLGIAGPFLAINHRPDGEVLQRLNSVHDAMLNNPAYPNPPVDMAGFKAVTDAYTAAAAGAQHDGSKNAVTERDKRRADALLMYRLLGHYVELTSKNDMKTFVSSGFQAVSMGHKTPPQPVTVPLISSVDQGNTGQLLLTIRPVAHARHYEVRYAPVPALRAPLLIGRRYWQPPPSRRPRSITSLLEPATRSRYVPSGSSAIPTGVPQWNVRPSNETRAAPLLSTLEGCGCAARAF